MTLSTSFGHGSCRAVCLAALSAMLAPLAAQDDPSPARLLRDIEQSRQAADVSGGFTLVGPWSYFAVQSEQADGLYRTLGTRASTELFFDPDPSGPQRILLPTAVGGRLFFFADQVGQGLKLYVSDGTATGTRSVDVPGSIGIDVRWARGLGDLLVFYGDPSGGADLEPWISDGTVAGTRRLVETIPGPGGGSLPLFPTLVPDVHGGGDRLWFQVWQLEGFGARATSFWSTDGTPAGTVREAELAEFVLPQRPTVQGPGRLVFNALAVSSGFQLVALDQGRGLTSLPSTAQFTQGAAALPNDGLVCIGVDGDDALLATDGTVAGTRGVPLQGGGKRGASLVLTSDPGRLLFAYQVSEVDWRLGQLVAGAAEATDLVALPGRPALLQDTSRPGAELLGNRLLVVVERSSDEVLIEVDLAAVGGPQARTVFDGAAILNLARAFGQLLFVGRETQDEEPWITDGRVGGATRLLEMQGPSLGRGSDPQMFVPFGDRLAFVARQAARPFEPFVTDGTTAGTVRLGALDDVRTSVQFILSMVAVGDELWSLREDPRAPLDLLVEAYDGRPDQRRLVGRLVGANGRFGTSAPGWPAALGDAMLVYAVRDDGGRGVHAVQGDGSVERILPTDQAPEHIVALGEQALLVLAPAPARQRELWLTDGSVGGTRLVGTAGAAFPPTRVARFRDHVWLSMTEGLFKVGDQGVEQVDPTLREMTLVAAGDRLFAVGRSRLVVTDGSSQGAVELASGGGFGEIGRFIAVAFGDGLLFVRDGRAWVSDGTVAGTVRLSDIALRSSEFWVTGRTRALFPGLNPATGARALFVTDGTSAGTRWLEDLPVIDNTGLLHEIGIAHAGKVFVLVDDPQVGIEPFIVDPRFAQETRGAPCAGSGYSTATLTLTGGDPRLGQSLRLDARAVGARLGWLALGPVARRPIMLPGSSCSTNVELVGAAISQDLAIRGDVLQAPLQVPNTTALLGVRVAVQAWLATGRGPLGLDVSETLVMTIGR